MSTSKASDTLRRCIAEICTSSVITPRWLPFEATSFFLLLFFNLSSVHAKDFLTLLDSFFFLACNCEFVLRSSAEWNTSPKVTFLGSLCLELSKISFNAPLFCENPSSNYLFRHFFVTFTAYVPLCSDAFFPPGKKLTSFELFSSISVICTDDNLRIFFLFSSPLNLEAHSRRLLSGIIPFIPST